MGRQHVVFLAFADARVSLPDLREEIRQLLRLFERFDREECCKLVFRLCGPRHSRRNWLFLGSDQGVETAAICFTILANAKCYRIEPFAYVRALLIALSSDEVDLESLLPAVWGAAHPEHFLQNRHDEPEAAANARCRRRAFRRERARVLSPTV